MTYLLPPPIPFQLLEINIISAQDLSPVSRAMRTYAVAWVHADRKLSTRVDQHGHNDPTWNDKFIFRVDDLFLRSETSAVMIEIYALRCFRDSHVGTVRVLLSNLLPPQPPSSRPFPSGTRFVALQIRRPSGRPQGILNIGVAILDGSMRSMPLYSHFPTPALGYRNLMGESHHDPNHSTTQPQLRRTKSDIRSEMGADDHTSVVEGSEFAAKGGSVWSESVGPVVGPPSVVKKGVDELYSEEDSSVLDGWSMATEDLKTKLERWRTELPPIYDHRGFESFPSAATTATVDNEVHRHRRRNTDVGGGLFSCFGDSFGCECSISCGLAPRKKPAGAGKVHLSPSDVNDGRSFRI
ncbi:uncharacterized protein LOC143862288 [Tasmannia lanceolata]|uniref:uncharacterized protein LOC143862288 n=1 Tax=Tasmannia lanceolata TaxID=3420 RepID=UPI004064457C